jgi:hypothetical protein
MERSIPKIILPRKLLVREQEKQERREQELLLSQSHSANAGWGSICIPSQVRSSMQRTKLNGHNLLSKPSENMISYSQLIDRLVQSGYGQLESLIEM